MRRTPMIRAIPIALLLAPCGAIAKDKPAVPEALPPVFQAVMDCRTVAGDAERLACYDRSVSAMADARAKQDLVVADRETLRETKRGLFGFTLPHLKLFGSTEGEDVNEIEATLTSVRQGNDGLAVFAIETGARWKQTEGSTSFARAGQKIRISRGALGGYWAKIDGDRPVRVIRLAN